MLFTKREIYSTMLFFPKTEVLQNKILHCPRALRPRKLSNSSISFLESKYPAINLTSFRASTGYKWQTAFSGTWLVRKCSLEAVLFHSYMYRKNVNRCTHKTRNWEFLLQTFYIKATLHYYTKNVRSDVCRACYKVHWSRVILWIVSSNQVNDCTFIIRV